MLPLWVHFGRGVSHMLIHTRQRGVSLIELMIGLVVGMIVVAGVIAIYVTNVRGGTYTIRTAKLNQELRAIMDIMVSDIRRAGVWGGAVVAGVPAGGVNPFSLRSGSQTDINIHTFGGAARSCVMFAYDRNLSGDATAPLSEVFGFRFNTDRVEMLSSGNQQTSDCTGNGWSAVTDNNTVVVDALTFSFTGSQCMNGTKGLSWKLTAAGTGTNACSATGGNITMNAGVYAAAVTDDVMIETRQVVITLQGHHKDDAATALTLVENVQVQNDRLYSQP